MTPAELSLHRYNTAAFIAANSTVVTLTPRAPWKNGTGTKLQDGTPRAPMTCRLIDQSSTSGPQPGTVSAGDGQSRRVQYQLLAPYDAPIGIHDYWIDASSIRWEVTELLPDNGYERRAQVVRYGES